MNSKLICRNHNRATFRYWLRQYRSLRGSPCRHGPFQFRRTGRCRRFVPVAFDWTRFPFGNRRSVCKLWLTLHARAGPVLPPTWRPSFLSVTNSPTPTRIMKSPAGLKAQAPPIGASRSFCWTESSWRRSPGPLASARHHENADSKYLRQDRCPPPVATGPSANPPGR